MRSGVPTEHRGEPFIHSSNSYSDVAVGLTLNLYASLRSLRSADFATLYIAQIEDAIQGLLDVDAVGDQHILVRAC
jgi:hypothetical protein